jgi:tetratricopeptide (TPR) repeat protein
MRIAQILGICSAILSFVPFSCVRETPGRTFLPAPSLDDSLSIEQSCIAISRDLVAELDADDTASLSAFYHVLDSTGARLAQSLGNRGRSPDAIDSILCIVYRTWAIGFDKRDMALDALLPHLVYKNRNGACLGVSLLILMLAEKVKCPVYGVMLPGHFFCRYDDGDSRFNIEPNRSGIRHPDEYYKDHYPVATGSWYDLRNLTKRETVGMFCYNAGAICLDRGKFDPAIFYCRQAMRRLNDLPEAKGNCALAYAQKGAIDSSLVLFKELFSQHPDFVNCAANYGTILKQAGRIKEAKEVFRKGLEYFPEDTVLKRGFDKSLAP